MRAPPTNIVSEAEERGLRSAPCIPSSMGTDYWISWYQNGGPFSDWQLQRIEERGLKLDQVETFIVYIAVSSPGVVGTTWRAIPCPKIGERRGKVEVIAPNGYARLIHHDGYVSAPPKAKVRVRPSWSRRYAA
jgi:hypothetical protein